MLTYAHRRHHPFPPPLGSFRQIFIAPPPPTWRQFFISEGIPHRTDSEIEKICSSHFIEPGDFDKPMSVRYWEDWFDIEGGP